MRNHSGILLFTALTLYAAAVPAQTPAGPEFVVETYSTGMQIHPAVAADPLGNFVVVWRSNGQDGSGYAVVGQRFDSAGARRGADFIANGATTGDQLDAEVAVDARGDFVVVWSELGNDRVNARVFDRSGAPAGGDIPVNQTGIFASVPSVATDAAGNFVVVWRTLGSLDASGWGVIARRFDADGRPLGPEFLVNTYTTGDQRDPDVAALADGGFVVAFHGPDASTYGVFARRYDVNGAPLGTETAVATSAFSQFSPAVAALPQGGFVVAWGAAAQDGSQSGVFARTLGANGTPASGELAVNTYTTGNQGSPSIAADGTGGFVVTWDSIDQDGSGSGVYGQRFDPAGARVGDEFALHTYTTSAQFVSAVAADSAGNFTAVWAGDGPVATGQIWARRFQGLLPDSILVDALGNFVLEPLETARLHVSWRNATDAAVTFVGLLSDFSGPTPGVYSIVDNFATYSTFPPGAVRSCLLSNDCYDVTVSAPQRPAVHWDASVIEALAGGAVTLGLRKRWVLHVGDSFTDVPRSSSFYPFVERLLHHGVTAGCTATEYCPLAATTREQMAVFVLIAREGPDYVPPACGAPMFADVPAASPFCRWIQELVRRGVVSGCGGGNYCPTQPVSREQMSVFALRTLDASSSPPACVPPNFYLDVPETSPFCRWIEELTRRGVVSGCGGSNYCPTAPVTREQMGIFIGLTFGLALYGP